jgi:xylan 1,4-beta-xylosidase
VVYRPRHALHEDLTWLRTTLDASPFPKAETMLTEWNASANNNGELFLDTAYMAPFVIESNIENIGLVDSLGFWAFTDVFEEQGGPDTPFHGYFNMINLQGIPKPSYNGYWMLARLGAETLGRGDGWFAARKDDTLQVILWNYCHFVDGYSNIPGRRPTIEEATSSDRYACFAPGTPRVFDIRVDGLTGPQRLLEHRVDRDHGSACDAWLAAGAPLSPDADEIAMLQRAARPGMRRSVVDGGSPFTRSVEVPPHGAVLLELQKLR